MGARPPPSGSLAVSGPLNCSRWGTPGQPHVISAGDSGPPSPRPPGEPETWPRAALVESHGGGGGDPRAPWAPSSPREDSVPAPASLAGSGEIRVPWWQKHGFGEESLCGAGAQHLSSCLWGAKPGCRGPAAPGGGGCGARFSASPAAVCSTATRGRCALVLRPGSPGQGFGGGPCAFLLWIRRGQRILASDAHCEAVQW